MYILITIYSFFFALVFSWPVYSALEPPLWRLEFDYGKANSHYTETQPSLLFEDVDINQKSDIFGLSFRYYALPPYIDASIGIRHTGLNASEPSNQDEQFVYLTTYGNIGFTTDFSDFVLLKMVVEKFYTTMIVPDNAFGFRNLTGTEIYPVLELLPYGTDMFLQISPYYKAPIWSDVGGRKETTFGLNMKFPIGELSNQRFPVYAYQKNIKLKLYYSKMELKYTESNYVLSEMDIEQYAFTIGFDW